MNFSVSWEKEGGLAWFNGEYIKSLVLWRLMFTWMKIPVTDLVIAWNEKNREDVL